MSKSSERIPLTKRQRFEIFGRDSFTCRYCGRSPPSVMLVVDHVVPVKDGGTNVVDNLATSCEECNQGKAAKPLLSIQLSPHQRMTIMQERMEEIAAAKLAVEADKMRKRSRQKLATFFMKINCLSSMLKSNVSVLSSLEREFGGDLVCEWIECANARVDSGNERRLMMYIYGCARRTRERNNDAK